MKLLPLIVFFSTCVSAQIGMQNWRIHFSSFEAVNVTKLGDVIIMAAENGIIEYNLISNEISTLTGTNGLSDLGISALSSNGEVAFIGYSNGNLDLIKGNQIINVPWLKRALISGSKSVNNFFFHENVAYISTSLGLLVYDIEREEVSNTYYPYDNPEVMDMTIYNDTFYVATSQGIYTASQEDEFLNNTASWTKKTNLPAHLIDGKINEIETFGEDLFFALDIAAFDSDTLYQLTADTLLNFYNDGVTIKRLSVQDNNLVVSRFGSVVVYDETLKQIKNIFDYSFGQSLRPVGAVFYDDELWIADKNNGLTRAGDAFGDNKQVYANTPFQDGCYRMDIQKGKALVAGGGLTHNLLNNYSRRGVYVFEDETWTNINSETHPETMQDTSNWDVIAASINPNNTDQMAFSSYSRGGLKIVENGTDIVESYNYTNSPLELQQGNFSHILSDLKYDNSGNLWVANYGILPLKMLTPEGKWYSFSLGSDAKNKFPYRLMIDSRGYKWVAIHQFGVVVFDDNGTYDITTDDRIVVLTGAEGGGNLPSVNVKAITEDIDGEVWIGTEDGIGVMYSTATLFDGGYGDADASTIVIYDDEKADFVAIFDKVTVTAIAVDGGNRKWIGTDASGVFCMSPNGKEEVYHFDASNSPLISNSILDLKIDYESGEIFFVTESGLISYRGDLTSGDNTFSNVKVFPNPVRPEYTGVITIEGVGYESAIRITDVSGNLVYQTASNGGSVLWDGNRLSGERVQSGVYLVWSARQEGKGKNVAKILVIN